MDYAVNHKLSRIETLQEIRYGLAGEVGELLEMYKKGIRDYKHYSKDEWIGEIGDILHYLTRLTKDHGFTLDEVIDYNIKKIKIRSNIK